jgi:superfamily II DNA helicase RecQ
MGIDNPDIKRVALWHLPRAIEGYFQRCGGANRDGGCLAWNHFTISEIPFIASGQSFFETEDCCNSRQVRLTKVITNVDIPYMRVGV